MNELSTINTALQIGNDSDYDNAASTKYLQSLRFFSKGDDTVGPGHYGVKSGTTTDDLGDKIDVMVFARKMKAIDFSTANVIEVNDTKTDTYQDVKQRAQTYGSNCMEGPSYLLYERRTGQFYELFCCSADLKRLSAELATYMRVTEDDVARWEAAGKDVTDIEPHDFLPATLTKRKQGGKYSRQVPISTECSLPFTNLPVAETIVSEIGKFLTVRNDGVAVRSGTASVR
jgi:hypothetical protein